MKIDVLWTPGELEGVALQQRTAVVIDVLRAGTTVTAAIAAGARAVVPAESTEEALRIAHSIGRGEVLLCGERQGARIEGFDLGNSPADFTPEVVRDRILVMTTTNGTEALMEVNGARTTFVGALVNLTAVARAVQASGGDPLVICAGRQGMVGADDALCAGLFVEEWLAAGDGSDAELNDGAIAALALAREHGESVDRFFGRTAAGRALVQIGHGDDVEFCARRDTIPEVPVYRERQITRAAPAGLRKGRSEGDADGG
jgi:2-phosphosulfolactate phosphatase